MKHQWFMVSVVVVCASLGSTVWADLFTVEDNLTDGLRIRQGRSLNGTFDINPVIPTTGEYALPYDVTSAYFTFTFEDDGELRRSGSTQTRYTYSYSDGYIDYYIRNKVTCYYDNYEQITLNIEGQYSTDGTTWYDSEQYEGYSYNGGYWYWGRYQAYYTEYYTQENGYTGSVTLTEYLEDDVLASLSADGLVGFTLTANYGDICYTGGTLTADITPSPVPTPTAFLLGTIGLGMARWRLRKQKAAA